METRAHYVAVGIFVLSAIILVFVAVLYLAHFHFGEQFERYNIFFKGSVEGLDKGSQVEYNGIPIGRVVDIRVDPYNIEQVEVTVEINTSVVVIRTGARAYLDSSLLSGIATIQIRGGSQQAKPLEPQPGLKYAEIPPARTALEEVQARLPEVVADLKRAADRVNALLDRQNRAAFAETLQNIRAITGNAVAPSRKLDEVVDNANKSVVQLDVLLQDVDRSVVGHGGLKDQASQALGDYDRVAKSLLADSQEIHTILAENRPGIRDFTRQTLPEVNGLVSDLHRFVLHATRLATELQHNPTRLLFGDQREGYRPQ
jgi:phospholipid/cholesterol/gamma-HCH transport system substrate-binding protein